MFRVAFISNFNETENLSPGIEDASIELLRAAVEKAGNVSGRRYEVGIAVLDEFYLRADDRIVRGYSPDDAVIQTLDENARGFMHLVMHWSRLSSRQIEALKLTLDGYNPSGMADQMGVRPDTARSYVRIAMKKIDKVYCVNSRIYL